MSDRIAIMDHGRIHQIGSPGEVYERPANPFVGRFLGEANLIDGAVTGDTGEVVRLRLPSGQELRAPRSDSCGTGGERSCSFGPSGSRLRTALTMPATARPTRSREGSAAARFLAIFCVMPWMLMAPRRSQSICRTPRVCRHYPSERRWCCAGQSWTV
jgi:hypothetical protein